MGGLSPDFHFSRSDNAEQGTPVTPRVTIAELLEHLPAALVAVRRELRLAGRS